MIDEQMPRCHVLERKHYDRQIALQSISHRSLLSPMQNRVDRNKREADVRPEAELVRLCLTLPQYCLTH
jgi:hypothetical protein